VLPRRTQQFGYEYNYTSVDNKENRLKYIGVIPQWLKTLTQRLYDEKILPWIADQIIINEYEPGQGISPHVDHITSFEGVVASISLLSGVIMNFTSLESKEQVPVYLERRSIVVLSGDSRYIWTHGIDKRTYDMFKGTRKNRGRRISITLRKAILT